MLQKILLSFIFAVLLISNGKAQMFLSDIEMERIGDEKVEEYISRQMENDVETFSDVKPSLTSVSSTDGFRFHEREYVVKDSIDKVWNHYVGTNPAVAWNASRFGFGMLVSKNDNKIAYPGADVEGVKQGQVIYLNLNLLKGIKNIATAFEIITVDENEGVIEFSYLEDNTTHGKQQLSFVTTPKGHTKIVHRSYFKSKSVLRDHFLYPYFHTRLTNTYHRNMKKMYNAAVPN